MKGMMKKGHDEAELDQHKTFLLFFVALITSGARKLAENETKNFIFSWLCSLIEM